MLVPIFGGMLPGENGIAITWNVPRYNVDLGPFDANDVKSLLTGDDGANGKACPVSDGIGSSFICNGSISFAIADCDFLNYKILCNRNEFFLKKNSPNLTVSIKTCKIKELRSKFNIFELKQASKWF